MLHVSHEVAGAILVRTTFGIGRRLFVSFAVLVSTLVVASYLTLTYVRQIHERLFETRQHEESVRLALELASAVRDQYAHQAHTIILGNSTHLPLYTDAERRVTALTALVAKHAVGSDERAWVEDVERSKLFEPFFTTKDSRTGKGLAVSQRIARAHGGEIEARSLPAGGAQFTLRLPATPPWRV
jgi:CHASE3 domain sensor protein